MTGSDEHPPAGRPAVLARLAVEADRHHADHPPPAWSRWAGRVLVVAIIVTIVVIVIVVHPW